MYVPACRMLRALTKLIKLGKFKKKREKRDIVKKKMLIKLTVLSYTENYAHLRVTAFYAYFNTLSKLDFVGMNRAFYTLQCYR